MTHDYELFPYQIQGADFLAVRRFGLLADEMGLGKSAQAVRACDLLHARRILVLCPAIARINWLREFDRFSLYGLPACALFTRTDRPGVHRDGPFIVTCSYDLASDKSIKAYLGAIPWDVMICDEAHYLKTMGTQRTKAVLGKHGLVKSAAKTWLLTGTPMTNHPGDLWPMLYVSGATTMKHPEFIDRFCLQRQTPFGMKIMGAKHDAIPELKALLNKIMLRRKKADVLKDLPPITYATFTVEPGEVDLELKIYELWRRAGGEEKLRAVIAQQESMLANSMAALKHSKAPLRDLLPIMTGLEKSLSELRQYTGLAKCPAVIEMITREFEFGALDKIVIFACHKSVIETLREGLKRYKPVTLYGGTPPQKRQENLDKFQNDPRCRVFIGNILACGTAVTLTSACEAMFVEVDWTPANNAQAAMRVHRIGQSRPVRLRYVALANSTDERVMEALRRKTRDELEIFGK
jgi:SWI/SNF-related matrix-associated actin-dependent regulator 1 of chromatin subfamily A